MKYLIILISLLSFGALAEPESYYRDLDCTDRSGKAEHRNSDGTYTDCLTDEIAIEYDFAPKWYECITQAGHYSIETGKLPVCVLIFRRDTDIKYLQRAIRFTSKYHKSPIAIQVIQ